MNKPHLIPAILSTLCVAVVGCSGRPSAIQAPSVDPGQAATRAVQQFDANGDQLLDEKELRDCPSLLKSMSRYDRSGDGKLDHGEIASGIESWASGRVGVCSVSVQVSLRGAPLANAQVKLVPESFLNGAISPALGKTSRGGQAAPGMAKEDLPSNAPKLPLVQPGLYRVEITHPTKDIPPEYNSSTKLGIEVSEKTIVPGGFAWDLRF